MMNFGLGEGWVPIKNTWGETSRDAPALFPSEMSARWFLREHRKELIEDEAIAYHLGRVFVHEEKLRACRIRVALNAAKARFARGGLG